MLFSHSSVMCVPLMFLAFVCMSLCTILTMSYEQFKINSDSSCGFLLCHLYYCGGYLYILKSPCGEDQAFNVVCMSM